MIISDLPLDDAPRGSGNPLGFMIMKSAPPERKSMKVQQWAAPLVGLFVVLKNPPSRDERGLSQSAENAILLAGAVTVAGIVITLITAYVRAKLPKL
jgi:hypothetical protein